MATKKSSLKEAVDAAGWALGIAGFVFLVFGLVLFINPVKTVADTVFFFGFVLFVVGILNLIEGALFSKGHHSAGLMLATGLVSTIIGLIMFLQPVAVTGGVLIAFGFIAVLLAFLALVAGIAQIIMAFKSKSKLVPILVGILYIALGLFMLFNPLIATLALVSLLGLFAIIYGSLMIVIAANLRNLLGQ